MQKPSHYALSVKSLFNDCVQKLDAIIAEILVVPQELKSIAEAHGHDNLNTESDEVTSIANIFSIT